jgi:hypothetical protein
MRSPHQKCRLGAPETETVGPRNRRSLVRIQSGAFRRVPVSADIWLWKRECRGASERRRPDHADRLQPSPAADRYITATFFAPPSADSAAKACEVRHRNCTAPTARVRAALLEGGRTSGRASFFTRRTREGRPPLGQICNALSACTLWRSVIGSARLMSDLVPTLIRWSSAGPALGRASAELLTCLAPRRISARLLH